MISFDGFIDSYYSYDFNLKNHEERMYTTQAVVHNNPSINLVHAGINLQKEKYRGRFALQWGDSVTANTLFEINPSLGHIQESYAGIKIGEKTWLDAGIFLGHIGMESWISNKNWTYTRSFLSDYVPYYSLGLKLSHEFSSIHFEFHLLNGWQNISETNEDKSIGLQVKKSIEDLTLTYNNFLGNEKVYPSDKNSFRTYHNFISEYKFNEDWDGIFSFDIGTQERKKKSGVGTWSAASGVIRKKFGRKHALALRYEYYHDPEEFNVKTQTGVGFRVRSASINYDIKINKKTIWRNEFRTYKSINEIFPGRRNNLSQTDNFIVSSISMNL